MNKELIGHLSVPEELGKCFSTTIKLLNSLDIDYCLAGAMAIGITTNVKRYTKDIDILSFDSNRNLITKLLLSNNYELLTPNSEKDHMVRFLHLPTKTEIDIMYSHEMLDPEASSIEFATKWNVFSVNCKVMTPECSSWMYLHSDLTKHEADLISLMNTNSVDINKLGNYIKLSGQEFLIDKLNKVMIKASKEKSIKYRDGR